MTIHELKNYLGYGVSADGVVWSRWVYGQSKLSDTWLRPLRPRQNKCNGYLEVTIGDATGRKRTRPVHRLIAEELLGECPPDKEACHSDGNRANNCVSNLRWDTKSANAQDYRKIFRSRGEMSGHAKLKREDVLAIRRLAGTTSQTKLGRRFGVTQHVVAKILRGELHAHIV